MVQPSLYIRACAWAEVRYGFGTVISDSGAGECGYLRYVCVLK